MKEQVWGTYGAKRGEDNAARGGVGDGQANGCPLGLNSARNPSHGCGGGGTTRGYQSTRTSIPG